MGIKNQSRLCMKKVFKIIIISLVFSCLFFSQVKASVPFLVPGKAMNNLEAPVKISIDKEIRLKDIYLRLEEIRIKLNLILERLNFLFNKKQKG